MKQYMFKDEDTQTIINALAELPYKVSKSLIDDIVQQFNSALQEPVSTLSPTTGADEEQEDDKTEV